MGINDYKDGRNFPSKKNVSRLSPHLHHGEISPNTVWYEVKEKAETMDNYRNGDHYLSELDVINNPLNTEFIYLEWQGISWKLAEDIYQQLLLYVILLIVFALIKGVFMFFMRQNIIVISRYIEYDLKNDIYDDRNRK